MPYAVSQRIPALSFTSCESAISAWVVRAPMRRMPFATDIPRISSIPPMSISIGMLVRRNFIIGKRLWPPAMILAPGLLARIWMASETELAFW